MIRAILDTEPPRPSDAVALAVEGEEDTPPERAARRSAPLGRVRAALRGDLDNIVAKAMKKAPAERYPDARALAEDLRRYQSHEPVRARPDRWSYRAGRFVRRHRVAVAATLLVGLTLVGAVTVTARQMVEARRQRDRATFQARRAQASSEFMRNLVTQIGATPMTMREVLDRGRAALEQQYGTDQAFVARMLMELSGPYIDLGDDATAAEMMAGALRIANTLGDRELLLAAHCGSASDQVEVGDTGKARHHLAEAARVAGRGDASDDNAECANAETRLAMLEHRYEDAVAHARRAATRIEQDGDGLTSRYTSAMTTLATAYMRADRLGEALAAQRRVIEVTRAIGRGESVSQVVSLHNEAGILRTMGRWVEAEQRLREARALARGLDPSGEAPSYLLASLARVLSGLGRGEEALALVGQARAMGDLPAPFAAAADLAEAQVRLDRGEIAEARRVHAAYLANGSPAIATAFAVSSLLLEAEIARREGRQADARRIVDAALAETGYPAQTSGSQPELLARAAHLALDAGDPATASRHATQALRLAESLFGADAPGLATGLAHLALGRLHAANGRPDDARAELQQAVTLLDAAIGASHAWTAQAREAREATRRRPT
jgi:serine/threonine-protein kinase